MNDKKARTFIYRNARPLDIARWKFLFENGSQQDVLTALATYQNEDGGFGHALEPDCWNPSSAPIQTWVATEIIREIQLKDKDHPIVQGILKYLSSHADFDGHIWMNTVPQNNDFPHAEWWDYQEIQTLPYNPTPSLVGFILKFAKPDSQIYNLACQLAKEAYIYFRQHCPTDSMSTATCFVSLYEYLKETSLELINMQEFKELLHQQIQYLIMYDTDKWSTEYVCKPSQFIQSQTSDFYLANKEICDYECQFIADTQEDDGSWAITWSWKHYPEQWYISKNWWKSDWIIKNIRYIKAMK